MPAALTTPIATTPRPVQPSVRAARPRLAHHFTVDVEESFHGTALEPWVARSSWASRPSRVEPLVDRLLGLLEAAGSRGTFFVLGWVAQRHPGMVRRIAAGGHEVASHGWEHRRIGELGPQGFRSSVRRSRRWLEDLCGTAVVGYRAPSFSITRGREWALDILLEEGYRYDSSLFPVRRRGYGYAGGRPDLHRVGRPRGTLIEVPPTTLQTCGLTLPAGGGAYFRLLPYAVTRAAFRACARRGVPGTFYIHPWELDDEQPRIPLPALTRLRHYGGLAWTGGRLRRFLREFPCRSIAGTLGTAS